MANYAVNALKRQEGENALNGFLGPIIVYTQNWSKDDVPAKATWKTPGFYQFWIDGDANGSGGSQAQDFQEAGAAEDQQPALLLLRFVPVALHTGSTQQ